MADEPSAIELTQKLVTEQIKLLEVAFEAGDVLRVQKESAVLAAYSRRESGVFTLHQTKNLGDILASLTETSMQSTKMFGEHMSLLTLELRSFSDRADRATRLVAFCTIALVVATLLLACATGALVWVEMKKVEAPTTAVTPAETKP